MSSAAPFYDTLIGRAGISQTAGGSAAKTHDMTFQNEKIIGGGPNLNSSFSKFVAGNQIPDKSSLAEPGNDYFTQNQPNPPAS